MKLVRLAHAAAALLALAALATWLASGREGYTRWPNAKLEQADAPTPAGQDALLLEIGFDDGAAAPAPAVRSRFALGLLPGGFDARHLPSVTTACALALALSCTAVAVRALRRGSSPSSAGASPP